MKGELIYQHNRTENNQNKEGSEKQPKFNMVEEIENIPNDTFIKNDIGNISPFVEGEIFDPELELTNLKNDKSKKEHLVDYKKKLRFQKMGLANMQTNLFGKIQNNPDIAIDQLLEDNKKLEDELALTSKQRKLIRTGLALFLMQRWSVINFLMKNGIEKEGDIDGVDLYRKLFNREPVGSINAKILSCAIHLSMDNPIDYAYTRNESYTKGEIPSESEVLLATNSAGCKLNHASIPGLVIICENSLLVKEDEKEKIMIHEEQHVFNELFSKVHSIEKIEKLKIENLDELSSDQIRKKHQSEVDSHVLERAKDEIVAYFRDGSDPETIHKLLLDKNHMYSFGLNYGKAEKNEKTVLNEEYIKYVEHGILSFKKLLESGYSMDFTISILMHEPLSKWKKVVNRIIEEKNDKNLSKSIKDLRSGTEFKKQNIENTTRITEVFKDKFELMRRIFKYGPIKGYKIHKFMKILMSM